MWSNLVAAGLRRVIERIASRLHRPQYEKFSMRGRVVEIGRDNMARWWNEDGVEYLEGEREQNPDVIYYREARPFEVIKDLDIICEVLGPRGSSWLTDSAPEEVLRAMGRLS